MQPRVFARKSRMILRTVSGCHVGAASTAGLGFHDRTYYGSFLHIPVYRATAHSSRSGKGRISPDMGAHTAARTPRASAEKLPKKFERWNIPTYLVGVPAHHSVGGRAQTDGAVAHIESGFVFSLEWLSLDIEGL